MKKEGLVYDGIIEIIANSVFIELFVNENVYSNFNKQKLILCLMELDKPIEDYKELISMNIEIFKLHAESFCFDDFY